MVTERIDELKFLTRGGIVSIWLFVGWSLKANEFQLFGGDVFSFYFGCLLDCHRNDSGIRHIIESFVVSVCLLAGW